MKRTAAPFLASLLAVATAAVAQAPRTAPQDPALPPRYEVEIIVFGHRDFDPTEERFDFEPQPFDGRSGPLREAPVFDETAFADPPVEPPLPEPPPFDAAQALPSPEAQRAEALRVRPLAPDELDLGGELRKLRALSAYTPVLHAGWVQPGLPETDAQPFELATLGVLNPGGTVRVHLSRFLHITLDLTYEPTSAATPSGLPSAAAGDGLGELVLAQRYRLQATRSARSGELHYFDHPAFGVLVRVTPVPTPAEAGRRPAA